MTNDKPRLDHVQHPDRQIIFRPVDYNDHDRYRRLADLAVVDRSFQDFSQGATWLKRFWAYPGLVPGLLALALIIRLPLLAGDLWYDEIFTVAVASLPPARMIEALAGDVHPPLWYIMVSAWPVPPRVLALVFGLAALWPAKRVLDRLMIDRRPALIGLALMTISPFLIYHSGDARMYALLLFFILLGARAAIAGYWPLLGVSIGLGMLTHNMMALYIPGLIIIFAGEVSKPAKEVSKAILVAGVIYAPWALVAWQQLRAVSGDYWILPLQPGRVGYILAQLIAGYTLTGPALLIVAALGLGLLIVGIARAIQAGSYALIILAVGPVLIGVSLSVAIAPILIARVLIGVVPFLLALIAWGGYELYKYAGHWVTVAGVVGGIVCLFAVYGQASPVKVDYQARYNALGVRAGDQCFELSAGEYLQAKYYLPQCHHIFWADAPRKPNGLSDRTIAALGIERGQLAPGPAWIFATWEPYTPAAETDYLAEIVPAEADQFVLLENDFVISSAWRIER